MLKTPDRLRPLVTHLESGRVLTPEMLRNTCALQMLDMAIVGRQAIEEANAFNEEMNNETIRLLKRLE